LKIKSSSRDAEFKLVEVKIFDEAMRDITKVGMTSYHAFKDKIYFQFIFNYCKPEVIVSRFFVDFEFYQPGYSETGLIAFFDHPVEFDRSLKDYKCENKKSLLTAEYVLNKTFTPDILRELIKREVPTMKIIGVHLVTGDHRTHAFDFDSFRANVSWR
jgi:hypothetical protein